MIWNTIQHPSIHQISIYYNLHKIKECHALILISPVPHQVDKMNLAPVYLMVSPARLFKMTRLSQTHGQRHGSVMCNVTPATSRLGLSVWQCEVYGAVQYSAVQCSTVRAPGTTTPLRHAPGWLWVVPLQPPPQTCNTFLTLITIANISIPLILFFWPME